MGLRSMVSPNRGEPPLLPPILRQGSLYNLTLDQVQNQLSDLGKPLNAMNLDELLNTVIAVEQQIHTPASSSSSSTNFAPILPNSNNMNDPLSRKTVDEVWQEIIQRDDEGCMERPPTFGETTLEDFLVRASAINLGGRIEGESQPLLPVDPLVQQQAEWLQYQLAAGQQKQEQQQHMELISSSLPVFGNSISNAGYAENHQMAMPAVSIAMVRPNSSDSQMTMETKPPPCENIDKSIERRQKRMIKNRESAARSRARKQAYINQLEEEVRLLTDKNKRLKKQKEEEMQSHFDSTPKPRYQLRRTSSAPF